MRAVGTVEMQRESAGVDRTKSDPDDAADLDCLGIEQPMHGNLPRARRDHLELHHLALCDRVDSGGRHARQRRFKGDVDAVVPVDLVGRRHAGFGGIRQAELRRDRVGILAGSRRCLLADQWQRNCQARGNRQHREQAVQPPLLQHDAHSRVV